MDKLQQAMDTLYYMNLEIHANKNKIKLSLPIETSVVHEVSIPIVDTNTETETQYSDEYIYRKPWNKLNTIHKVIKIKEFINKLESDDIEMKKKIKNKLIDMVKEKKLTKKTDINYDSVNGCILSIPVLQYKDSKYIIA